MLGNKRELDIGKRAAELGLKLRREDDGCYWLDYVDQPDMRSIGPHDLDEVEDRITAVENEFTSEHVGEYMVDRR